MLQDLGLLTELPGISTGTKHGSIPLELWMNSFVIKTIRGVAWNGRPQQRMLAQSGEPDMIRAGDTVYSFATKSLRGYQESRQVEEGQVIIEMPTMDFIEICSATRETKRSSK